MELYTKDLCVLFATHSGDIPAVNHVSLAFSERQVTGIIGETGSGKSVLGLSILGLLQSNASVTGQIFLGERELTALSERELCTVRGREIALVAQNPATSLNPSVRVGRQIEEVFRLAGKSTPDCRRLTLELLRQMAFSDPEQLWDGPVFPLDLIACNGKYCLTIACNGIDAQVADSVHQISDAYPLSGRGSYLCSVAVNFLFRDIGHHWTVTLDDEVIEDDFALVSMCNGRYYGGGSSPVPQARMDDGVLHTILVRKVSRLTFGRLFPAYSAGDYARFPEIARVVTARRVVISSPREDIVTCLDGESFRSSQVVMTLADKRLNFFGPKGCDPNATARPAPEPQAAEVF